MRCALVLCAAALVGLSSAGWQYGVGGYSGHQQMPVRYYVPYAMSGHQHMYVPQPQAVNFPGYQQMPVKYYVPSAMSGHQHMYVPQPQVVNLDLDYSPSIAFPGTMHTVHNDGATKSGFDSRSGSVNADEFGSSGFSSRSGSVNADEFDSIDTNNTEVVNLGLQEEGISTERWWCQGGSQIKLDCGTNRRINITDAYYGRQRRTDLCRKKNPDVNDCFTGPYRIRRDCNGNQSCTVKANNGYFGNPCSNVDKYLWVKMECYRL